MRRLLVLLPVALLLPACGGSSSSKSGNGAPASGAVIKTIQISEKEYSLSPGTVSVPKAGTYAFDVTNHGQITHAFNIEQSGSDNEVEAGDISPGSHKTVKFTFSAGGSYEMYCPMDGHRQMGMEGKITVAGAAGSGGATTTGMTSTSSPGY